MAPQPYQPFKKGKARTPSQPLSAALKGSAANAPNPQDPARQLAKGAGKPQALRSPEQPPNRKSASGSTALKDQLTQGAMTTISNVARVNTTNNARNGKSFVTETRSDQPGYTFHVYTDPKTGKKTSIRVKQQPLKGVLRS